MRTVIGSIQTFITGVDTTERVGKKTWSDDFHEPQHPACVRSEGRGGSEDLKKGKTKEDFTTLSSVSASILNVGEIFSASGWVAYHLLLLKFITAVSF